MNLPEEVAISLNAAATCRDFQNVINENSKSAMKGIYHFMSNSAFDNVDSPEIVYKDSEGKVSFVQDLQLINPSSIGQTQTSNLTATTNIFVERATVKVDVRFDLAGQITTNGGAVVRDENKMPLITFSDGNQLNVIGWKLTVKNKSYYLVKKLNQTDWNTWLNADTYQMAQHPGGNYVDSERHFTSPRTYRSHFAIDPNFNGCTTSELQGYYNEFHYASYEDAITKSFNTTDDRNNPLYCVENTFNVENQQQNQTTSILIAAQYLLEDSEIENEDLFTVNGTVYNKDGVTQYLVDVLNMLAYKNGDQ